MLRRFENRIDPYPAAEPQLPPSGFFCICLALHARHALRHRLDGGGLDAAFGV